MAYFYLYWVGFISMILNQVSTSTDLTIINGVGFGRLEDYRHTDSIVYHMEADLLIKGNILFSDGFSLKSTDGLTLQLVAGNPLVEGYIDGSSSFARFGLITGFHQINSSHVIVADNGNNCLRLVRRELFSVQVTSFLGVCSKSLQQSSVINRPWSITSDARDPSKIILSELSGSSIQSIDLNTKQTRMLLAKNLTRPRFVEFSKNASSLYITNDCYVLNHDLLTDSVKLVAGNTKTCEFQDGWNKDSAFKYPLDILDFDGNVLIVADFGSQTVRLVDQQQRWTRSICLGKKPASADVRSCSLTNPSSLLIHDDYLYIGQSKAIKRIKVKSMRRDVVPQDKACGPVVVELAANETEANVEVYAGVLSSYSAGNYSVFIPSYNCAKSITVQASKNSVCPKNKVNLVADPVTGNGKFSYKSKGMTHHLDIPQGTHNYTILIDDQICSSEILVFDNNIRKQLVITAAYSIPCAAYRNSLTTKQVQTMAEHKYLAIEELCTHTKACKRHPTQPIVFNCENNILSISWPTDVEYTGEVTAVPQDLLLHAQKLALQSRSSLDLYVFSNTPPIIPPIINKNGSPVELALQTVCLNGKIYDDITNKCT